MNAYDVMHEWDRAMGIPPRSEEELDREVPPLLESRDYAAWKTALEARKVGAIREGMRIWGLPEAPLGDFEMDYRNETAERSDSPE